MGCGVEVARLDETPPLGLGLLLGGCVLSLDPVVPESGAAFDPRLLGAWEEVSGSDRAVVSEAGRVAGEVLAPINQSGDEAGCTWEDGVVSTPPGFKEAFAELAGGGWLGLAGAVGAGPVEGAEAVAGFEPLTARVAGDGRRAGLEPHAAAVVGRVALEGAALDERGRPAAGTAACR